MTKVNVSRRAGSCKDSITVDSLARESAASAVAMFHDLWATDGARLAKLSRRALAEEVKAYWCVWSDEQSPTVVGSVLHALLRAAPLPGPGIARAITS